MLRTPGLVIGLVALATSGATANASDITSASTSYGGSGSDFQIKYNFKGNNGSTVAGKTFTTKGWDGNTALPPTTTEKTWCVDLMNSIANSPKAVEVKNVVGLFNDGVGAIRNTGAAAWLAKAFDASATNSTKRAALQLAIWEAIYDTDGNLAAGDFKVNQVDGAVKSQAQTYLNAALSAGGGGAFAQAIARVYSFKGSAQDQMSFMVPEPSAFAMAGLALLAGLAVRSRNRRKAAAN